VLFSSCSVKMHVKIGTFLSCGGGGSKCPPNPPSYGPDVRVTTHVRLAVYGTKKL